jgi:hypothetical protein
LIVGRHEIDLVNFVGRRGHFECEWPETLDMTILVHRSDIGRSVASGSGFVVRGSSLSSCDGLGIEEKVLVPDIFLIDLRT